MKKVDSKPTKNQQAKLRIKDKVTKLLGEGDFEGMDDLFSRLSTIRDSEAALESLRDNGLKAYSTFVHQALDKSARSRDNPLILFHLVHELLLRSMISDYAKAERIQARFPIHQYVASVREAANDLVSGNVSFAGTERIARDTFTTCYENYTKLCKQFAQHAANAKRDQIDNAREWKTYLSKKEPQYSRLLPDKTDTFIRNAISHKDSRRLKTGKYELRSKDGVTRVYTANYLDNRLAMLWLKIQFSDFALSLAGLFSNQMLLVALRQNKRWRQA